MSATQDLLSNYQHVIEDLTLVTGGAGVFDVIVSNADPDSASAALLYSKKQTGRHAHPGEILSLFTELIGPNVPRYGT